jgi:hypothetical protein
MSGTTTVTESMIGQTCTFQSKNTNDTITYQGIIQAITTNIVAATFTDLVSYNAAVRQVDPTVPTDLTQETYIILTLTNAGVSTTNVAFATDWMTPGSFQIISQDVSVNVVVYDASSSNHQGILEVLRAAGYSCYIASVS